MLAAGSEHADLALLKLLVSHGADVNAIADVDIIGIESGETPFSCASGSVEKMRYLLTVGANPFTGRGASKRLGWTTSIQALKFQLELGFDPTIWEDHGPSMLVSASRDCDWEKLKLFEEFDFCLDSLYWTELMHDIIFGSAQRVAEHLSNGGDDHRVDFWERSPLLLSICSGSIQKAQLVLDAGGSLDDRGRANESAIDCAILSKSSEMLSWLLLLGLNANMRGISGYSPLMSAAEKKNPNAIKILLEHGAVVNATAEFDMQAINFVEDAATMKLLAAAGADINHMDKTGSFPLLAAVEACSIELMRCLLELGAHVDNRSYGMAALHQATNYDELEIMKLLLSAGADPNLPGEDGLRPLWYAKSHDAAKILVDAGASSTR